MPAGSAIHRIDPAYLALTPSGVYQVVEDAVDRAHITKRVCPHLMRHSWMTEMLRNGMNPIFAIGSHDGTDPDTTSLQRQETLR
jgi:integrase